MNRTVGALAGLALSVLLALTVREHEVRRGVTFAGLADGATGVHPARSVEVLFHGRVPLGTTAAFEGPAGRVGAVTWQPPEGGRTLIAQAAEPLAWDTGYRFCVTRPRRDLVQRLAGPRQSCIAFRTQAKPPPLGASDAPILVVTGPDRLYGAGYGAILSAEGFTDHATVEAGDLAPDGIAGRDVILLATSRLPAGMVAGLAGWVRGGGLLLAMRPDAALLAGLGLHVRSGGRMQDGTLTASPTLPATRGLTPIPLGLHGMIDLFDIIERGPEGGTAALAGARSATPPVQVLGLLRDRHGTRLPYPAGILASEGAGMVAAFPFDLAETVTQTRQGNPRWIDQERDGHAPRRPNDLFFPDHVARERMHAPQADELQRLLANLIVTQARGPVPRFWYLPDRRRAVIVMAGDDHATPDGTRTLFARLYAASPEGCRTDRWECLRATSYLSPGTPLDPAAAAAFARRGFEIGAHVDTGCQDSSDAVLRHMMVRQLREFRLAYPDLPTQRTERVHCIVWNGWVDVPQTERAEGIRFDMNYYSWPPDWLQQRPGFMAGSGFPMPFMDENGRMLDIYQQATHMVNESGVPQVQGIASLLDRALGPDQFFGAFGAHSDYTDDYAQRLIEAATARGVALVTARQMLDWVEGRNASVLRATGWGGGRLDLEVAPAPGAERASVMLPEEVGEQRLASVSCRGVGVPLEREEIKGIAYGTFLARPGPCAAEYGTPLQQVPVSAGAVLR